MQSLRGLKERPKFLDLIDENYVIWGNRPVHPFKKHFHLQRIELPQLESCSICAMRRLPMFRSKQPHFSVTIATRRARIHL